MEFATQENRIIFAIEAIRSSKKISQRHAAKLYNIPLSTLRDRINGKTSKANTRPPMQKLTESEEYAIVQYILDRDTRRFSPRLADVADMANLLLKTRNMVRVGTRWAQRFVQRRPELKTRINRAYDYQRALCEDPEIIGDWFRLVENMRAKYGIQDCDFYNFDETGFMMGMIRPSMVITRSDRVGKPKKVQPGNREWATAIVCVAGDGYTMPPVLAVSGRYHLANWYSQTDLPDDWIIKTTSNGWTDNQTGLEWLRHFDQCSKPRRKGAYRMLVLDGHESHVNADFEAYCKDNNIIPLCLPSHSSHLT